MRKWTAVEAVQLGFIFFTVKTVCSCSMPVVLQSEKWVSQTILHRNSAMLSELHSLNICLIVLLWFWITQCWCSLTSEPLLSDEGGDSGRLLSRQEYFQRLNWSCHLTTFWFVFRFLITSRLDYCNVTLRGLPKFPRSIDGSGLESSLATGLASWVLIWMTEKLSSTYTAIGF